MTFDEQGDPVVPHEAVEDVTCDGCLFVTLRGEHAYIMCNECGAVVAIVPPAHAAAAVAEMASREGTSARCPHCGTLNFFLGIAQVFAYVCQECGASVAVKKTMQ